MKYFIPPSLDIYAKIETKDKMCRYKTYTEYNYLCPVVSWFKTRHFEACLRLTRQYFHKINVIDFGCADGPFVMSLSRYFNYICGIDRSSGNIGLCHNIFINQLQLNNVGFLCNEGLSFADIRQKLRPKKYQLLFLLETLEHIGEVNSLYESKTAFLKNLFTLFDDDDALILISVPNMAGLSFLIQRIGITLLGLTKEPIALTDILKAGFMYNTDALEKKWNGGHLGFNQNKMETHLRKYFRLLHIQDIFFQTVYVIKNKK
jgi:2-polyprenyl-3-methyl-5-hydroxy-6-metoxy-1,4-benzoquinol methylase